MAKSKFGLGKIFLAVAALLGVVAIIMMFAPHISAADGDLTYSGMQVTFGYTKTTEVLGSKISTKILNFSFLNLLAYILVLAGVVFVVLAMLGKLGRLASFVAMAAFVVGGVLFFLVLNMTAPNVGEATGDVADALIKAFKDPFSLGIGAILAGVASILAGVSTALATFLFKK